MSDLTLFAAKIRKEPMKEIWDAGGNRGFIRILKITASIKNKNTIESKF
jgi:hypothetical protein